jgi:hypothetical protein
MRPPSILDVVRAVKAVAAAHEEVGGWWYAPAKRLRLAGERPASRDAHPVELAVEGELEPSAHAAIASEVSRALRGAPVRVRAYRGKHDDGHLFRLLSADGTLRASG